MCIFKKRCVDNLKLLKCEIQFCFECNCYPCEVLTGLDNRYRQRFDMSTINNLNDIISNGIDYFIKNQEIEYKCPKCDNLISVHSKKCFNCDKITDWKS